MMSEMITDRIRQFIVDTFLYGDQGGVANSTSLTEAGIVDSTGILELISFLENEFSITVEDDELTPENLDSLERLSRFITQKAAN
jgi:acyl carrier protein